MQYLTRIPDVPRMDYYDETLEDAELTHNATVSATRKTTPVDDWDSVIVQTVNTLTDEVVIETNGIGL